MHAPPVEYRQYHYGSRFICVSLYDEVECMRWPKDRQQSLQGPWYCSINPTTSRVQYLALPDAANLFWYCQTKQHHKRQQYSQTHETRNTGTHYTNVFDDSRQAWPIYIFSVNRKELKYIVFYAICVGWRPPCRNNTTRRPTLVVGPRNENSGRI